MCCALAGMRVGTTLLDAIKHMLGRKMFSRFRATSGRRREKTSWKRFKFY